MLLTESNKNFLLVDLDNTGKIPIELLTILLNGTTVSLKEHSFIKVFRIVSKDGDMQ